MTKRLHIKSNCFLWPISHNDVPHIHAPTKFSDLWQNRYFSGQCFKCPWKQKGRLNFLISNWFFELKIIFALFLTDCWYYFNCKLRNLANRQIIIFYSPSNALCSSGKSVEIKNLKHYNFINMCFQFTWFNLLILHFC